MFKTKPFISERVWGNERWIVSTHKAGLSLVDSTDPSMAGEYLSDVIPQPYPILIKVIQADQTLSVQVHPDDAYAQIHEHSPGKTECWYILDAVPGAEIVYGLKEDYSAQEIYAALENGTIEGLLRSVPIEKGDFIFIPAGTVHAIKGGIRLLEVQQASDITYRLYDWGRPRELHIHKGLDVIRYLPDMMLSPEHPFRGTATCIYFKLERKTFSSRGILSFGDFTTPAAKTGWGCLFIIEGSGVLEMAGESPLRIKAEDCIMVQNRATLGVIPDEDTTLSLMMIG
ncbi:MAG: type I phosphomannose isomerase catalytic subunit [Treponema sp.]|uniref:type I phosphomannose isomerase catalytic subunit n=1 Tax=Treponema sp. TaxID=166 RepID=UPI003FA30ACD